LINAAFGSVFFDRKLYQGYCVDTLRVITDVEYIHHA